MKSHDRVLWALALVLATGCSHGVVRSVASAPTEKTELVAPPPSAQALSADALDPKIQTLLDQGYYYYARADFSRAIQNSMRRSR